MTRDEILNMPAGREMDTLIAERVMDWQGSDTYYMDISMFHNTIPSYSTNISAAWEVVEKMHSNEWEFYIEWTVEKLWAMFTDADLNKLGESEADTAPLAICRAALLVILKDVD